MNNLIDAARYIPINDAVPTISVSPVTLPAPDRGLPLELRVTAPASGRDLPIILLSHGHGPSLYIPSKDGYGPLVNFYAEHGFVVIQPTHANSKVAGLDPGAAGGPLFLRSRVNDMKLILDRLDEVEAQVPAVADRLDHGRVAAVGHSAGSHTVALLLGARLSDPMNEATADTHLAEPRVKAGVLLAGVGRGGDLTDVTRERYPELGLDFSRMATQTLVVYGDADVSPHLTSRGADWHADPYHLSPGANALLTLFGAKHGLGGVAGYDAKETDDEDPDRLAATQRLTWAYLRSALGEGDPAWPEACRALEKHAGSLGRLDRKLARASRSGAPVALA